MKIPLDKIDFTAQTRAQVHEDTISDYCERMQAGDKFPPVDVFHDGTMYHLADGFHRVLAAGRAAGRLGWTEIEAKVHKGSLQDAIKFGFTANDLHGLRRNNADKRHAVEMALKEWPGMADNALAKLCGVNNHLVSEVRSNLEKLQVVSPQKERIGLDGKTRKLPVPQEEKPHIQTADEEISRDCAAVDAPEARPGCGGQCGGKTAPGLAPPVKPATPGAVRPNTRDAIGREIPSPLLPLWGRAREAKELLLHISDARCTLRNAADANDPLYTQVHIQGVLDHLDNAYLQVKEAIPYAVCTVCQGLHPMIEQCLLCKSVGLISEFKWKTAVPQETKNIINKVIKNENI